jgi:hypothetical protein
MATVADSFKMVQTHSIWEGYDFGTQAAPKVFNTALPFETQGYIMAFAANNASILGYDYKDFDFLIRPTFAYRVKSSFTSSDADNSICLGDSISFTNSNTAHVKNPILNVYEWNTLADNVAPYYTKYIYSVGATAVLSGTQSGGIKYPAAGTYTAKALLNLAPWTSATKRDTATFITVVNAIPSAPVIAATGGTPTIGGAIGVCGGSSATISVNSPGAGTYAWSNAGSGSSINTSTAATYTVTNTANGCTSPASNAVTIVNCSELNENASSVFSVYPNPANDMLNVELNVENAVITLVSTEGKVIETRNASNAVETLNVKGLNAGVYFLNINANNNTYNQKVIIK